MSDDESDGMVGLDVLLKDTGYKAEKRIGEGTFSSVYSVIRVRDGQRCAVKRLIPTASPERILLEISSLDSAKGKKNVIPLDFVRRVGGDVLLGMPYVPSTPKFSELILIMEYKEMKSYIKNLFVALEYIHELGLIHRDIKPANFLYDRRRKKYALCDFGLVQKIKPSLKRKLSPERAAPVKTPTKILPQFNKVEDPTRTPPNSKSSSLKAMMQTELRRSPRKHPSSNLNKKNTPQSKYHARPSLEMEEMEKQQPSLTSRLSIGGLSACGGLSTPSTSKVVDVKCKCYGKPKVCSICLSYKPMKAPRAGTPGFRPPEVLLKYEHQTTAVDVWAVGIIMLYDLTALAEISVLFGSDAVHQAAKSYGKKFLYEPHQSGFDLQDYVTCCVRENLSPHVVKREIYRHVMLRLRRYNS
ncbi:CDC7 [Lepeophtheirus salmonis]|uniref:non-specific serine/threonine protein kinase n=1 Tax=Lepeophtheirus salmonis TaxID=72036 RepID=A0A7R8CID4_LEPSM|nr:CDC7 [Lepeophtheirus salmonis]CAF2799073.1 CDC7 [Lepeophtheirus salmonis]